MKRNFSSALTAAMALTMLLTACGGSDKSGAVSSSPVSGSASVSQQAGILSSFSTTDLEGNAVDQSVLADYDLTMVNVWATFCNPCLREMPDLGELAQEYEENGVQFIGLVSDVLDSEGSIDPSQVDIAKELVAETNADYLHLLPSEDLMGLLAQIYGVPTTFFVDSQGRQVGSAYVRAMSKDEWINVIDQALEDLAG